MLLVTFTVTLASVVICSRAVAINCSCACCCLGYDSVECQFVSDEHCSMCHHCNISRHTTRNSLRRPSGEVEGHFNDSDCITACVPFEFNCSSQLILDADWSWLPRWAWSWYTIVVGSSSMLLVAIIIMATVCRCARVRGKAVRRRNDNKRGRRLPTVSEIDGTSTRNANVDHDLHHTSSQPTNNDGDDDDDDDDDEICLSLSYRQETENGKSRAGFGTGRFPPESASHQLRSVDLMRELSERLEHRRHQIQATDESSQAFPSRNVRVTSLNHSNSDDECDDYMKPSTCFCESHDYENYRDDDAGDDDGAESGTSDSDTKSHDYINVFTCRL